MEIYGIKAYMQMHWNYARLNSQYMFHQIGQVIH